MFCLAASGACLLRWLKWQSSCSTSPWAAAPLRLSISSWQLAARLNGPMQVTMQLRGSVWQGLRQHRQQQRLGGFAASSSTIKQPQQQQQQQEQDTGEPVSSPKI
jgi:hypothetical protein